VPLYISGKHLILQPVNGLLERLMLLLELSVSIDFCSKRAVAYLPKGFVHTLEPHIVNVEKLKYVGSDRRGRDVDIDDSRGVNLTVVSGPIE
jgi:hypothetical protein